MNYRHAFHAGNFADVFKHAILARILAHLRRKATPFRSVDTHAGIGLYDLAGPEAERSPEWRDGIGRMEGPFDPQVEAILSPYREVVASVRVRHGPSIYPGSAAFAREMLRPGDHAILIEKHPDDAAVLSDRYNAVGTMKVLAGDGWALLPGLIPPPERRGLVLIDPPYEEPDEFAAAVSRLRRAVRKWPTGIFALWYPLKSLREADAIDAEVTTGLGANVARLELWVEPPGRFTRLAGTGLVVVNPPWHLDEDARCLLPALAERLGRGAGSSSRVDVLDG